ncbi:MAG: helix-turn-helix domain-containing protein [Halobacteriales archaeon]|nr:helix-turn-helix domain-containing protein [Halobacteriales archaeon]
MLNWLVSRYTGWRSERAEGSTGSDGTATTEPEAPPSGTDVEEEDANGPTTRAGGTTGERADALASWRDLLDGEEVSKQDVQMELGLQPHEFLVWLVRDAGGHMWQADMVDATGWSKSTVSRYLDTLESSGVVERVWIGRRKLVGVPGEMPDPISVSEGPTDGMSADTQTRVADGPP